MMISALGPFSRSLLMVESNCCRRRTCISSEKCNKKITAEKGADFLSGHTGILNEATLSDSLDYIQRWLNKMSNDKKIIIEVSGKAQKAVDYILNKEAS